MKKLIAIGATFACTILCVSISRSQTYTSYNQTMATIVSFEKMKNYGPSTTGPILASILDGMIANNCVYGYPGFKSKLLNVSETKVLKQAVSAIDDCDGEMLALLFYTRQTTPSWITDKNLQNRVGDHGGNLKKSVVDKWSIPELNTGLITVLEEYPPGTAAILVDIISQPYWSNPARTYELTAVSWASESLWQIYYDIRLVELAKRSVVVKLLNDFNYICVPSVTYAEYRYSGWPDKPIYLDPVYWSYNDVTDLIRLLDNPMYCNMARYELHAMGYWQY